MNIGHLPLAYEERLSTVWNLPAGRIVTADFRVIPVALSTNNPREHDTVALAAEVKQPGADDFEEVARTAALSIREAATASIILPQPEKDPPFGERGPVFRLRLIHDGRAEPRFEIKVNGI